MQKFKPQSDFLNSFLCLQFLCKNDNFYILLLNVQYYILEGGGVKGEASLDWAKNRRKENGLVFLSCSVLRYYLAVFWTQISCSRPRVVNPR